MSKDGGDVVSLFAPVWVRLSARVIRLLPRGRYPLMNWLCRRPISPFVQSLKFTEHRMRFACDARDGIAREACFMGFYEPQESVLIQCILRPQMCFVDVGANWGYFTLIAADLVGPGGRVLSFEPHPTLFAQLQSNVLRNSLHWVTTVPIALADVEGKMMLEGFDEEGSNWGVSRLAKTPNSSGPGFPVRTGLLESLLNEHGAEEVDLLKIDIEGAEAMVLPTMKEGLEQGRYRHILLELHPEALKERDHSPECLIEGLLRYGYRGWRIDHSQSAFRRASYRLPDSPREFLKPLNVGEQMDSWPHFLFLAPGVEPSW